MRRLLPVPVILFSVACLLYPVSLHAGVYSVLYRFAGGVDDGQEPYGGLILHDGRLYGMAAGGGSATDSGTIYSINPDGSGYTQLRSFTGQDVDNDGAWPRGALYASGGKLYGMTAVGGCEGTYCYNLENTGCGTIFDINTDGTAYSVLLKFACGDFDHPAIPDGSLLSDGTKLYGTTAAGGQYSSIGGTVFSINPDGSGFTLLHEFNGTDGELASADLLLVGDILYGMTTQGGANNKGTIFNIKTDGTGFVTLHEFSQDTDGAFPMSILALYNNQLYGTTWLGGTNGNGTIFSCNTDGSAFTVIHHFDDSENKGAMPYAGLTVVGDRFYGVTQGGGELNGGVIYSIKPDGSEFTILHDFNAAADGLRSISTLVHDNGYLYGTCPLGGNEGKGVVYHYDLQNRPTPVPPTPTPTSTPVPTPGLRLILSSENPKPGDTFTVDLELQSVSGAFDSYGGISMPWGAFESFKLGQPTKLVKGVKPLISKVKGLRTTYSTRLFSGTVPNAPGRYQITVGLVPQGVQPNIANAIPKYIDQKTVTVQ